MGTEVEQRSEEQYQGKVLLLFYSTQSHIQAILSKISISGKYWDDLVSKVQHIQCDTGKGRLEQALEPSSGLTWSNHRISRMLPHRGVYCTHDQDQFVSPQSITEPWEE